MSQEENSSLSEENDISPLREAALQMHEMYRELTRAGFSKRQAVSIVSHILAVGVTEGLEEYGHIDDEDGSTD
jgi:hypothetical protein